MEKEKLERLIANYEYTLNQAKEQVDFLQFVLSLLRTSKEIKESEEKNVSTQEK